MNHQSSTKSPGQPHQQKPPYVLVDQLSKSYRAPGRDEDVVVLSQLHLQLQKGETLAIMGPSGSGKSTLLALLSGLDRPDHGSISIDQTVFTNLSESQLNNFRADHISIVFQQFYLLPQLTALENVALPLALRGDRARQEKAKAMLAEVGLHERMHHRPNQLSGGECQRVAIARALITAPSLLLADEPSGNLDQDTGEKVMKTLFDLVRKHHTSMILVTHNPELATWCDRSMILKQGMLHAAN